MGIYILALCLMLIAVLFVTDTKYRNIYNPAITFTSIWIIFLYLASLRLHDMYPTSDLAALSISLGVFFFDAGVIVSSIFKNTYSVTGKLKVKNEYELRYWLLIALTIMCILYYLPGFIKSMMAMLSGTSLNDVRSDIQSGEHNSGFANFIPNYVILPSAISVEVLAIVDFWKGKRNYPFIICVLFLVLVRALGDGGRTPLFNLVLYFIFAYLIVMRKSFERKSKREALKELKNKVLFWICCGGGIGGLVLLSLMRASSTIFRKLYWYFGMAPVMLTNWINYVDDAAYRGYGLISINGPLYLIDYFRKNLSGGQYLPAIIGAYDWIAQTDSYWPKIAPSVTANAYVSCFWFFYADGGILGVIVLSLLYGLACGLVFYRMCNNNNIRTITIFLFLFQGLFFSFIRFPFAKAYYFIAFLLLYFVAFRKKMR